MTSAEKRVRRKLLQQVTFEGVRSHLVEVGIPKKDVDFVVSGTIHRVRKILDYPGRRLGRSVR